MLPCPMFVFCLFKFSALVACVPSTPTRARRQVGWVSALVFGFNVLLPEGLSVVPSGEVCTVSSVFVGLELSYFASAVGWWWVGEEVAG